MLAGEAVVVDGVVAVGAAPVDLGRYDEVVALPGVLLDAGADYELGGAGGVLLGAVEEVDADVVGGFEAGEGVLWSVLGSGLSFWWERREKWLGISNLKFGSLECGVRNLRLKLLTIVNMSSVCQPSTQSDN